MLGKFKEAFRISDTQTIPQIIVDTFSKNLPEGFQYRAIDKDTLLLTPQNASTIKISVRSLRNYLPIDIEINNSSEIINYFYNSQEKIEIKDGDIILNDIKFRVADVVVDPFTDSNRSLSLKTPSFPPPQEFELTSEEEDISFSVLLERQPYRSVYTEKHAIKGIKGLDITLFINYKDNTISMNFNYSLTEDTSVEEVIKKLKLIRAFENNTIKFNGILISAIPAEQEGVYIDISESIEFWNKVLDIERKLDLKFNPSIGIDDKTFNWIKILYESLIKEKGCKRYVNLREFTMNVGEELSEKKIQTMKEKERLLVFGQKEIVTIFDVEINLYIVRAWYDYNVKNIKKISKSYNYKFSIEPKDIKGLIEFFIYFSCESEYKGLIDNSKKVQTLYEEANFFNEL